MTPWRNRPTTARTANKAPMEPNTFNPSEKTTPRGPTLPFPPGISAAFRVSSLVQPKSCSGLHFSGNNRRFFECVPAETRHNAKRNSPGRCGVMRPPSVANKAPLAVRRPSGNKTERQQSPRTLLLHKLVEHGPVVDVLARPNPITLLHVHTIKANARCRNGAHVFSTSRTDGPNCVRQRQFLEHHRRFPQHCHGCLQNLRVVQTDETRTISLVPWKFQPLAVVEQINSPHKFVSSHRS